MSTTLQENWLIAIKDSWKKHKATWSCCTRCEIGRKAMKHVLLRGSLPCDILFVGEAPGREENARGYPFIGPAGRLLQRMIDTALEKEKFTYAITNIVCCMPVDGDSLRIPSREEISNCLPRLVEIVGIASPMGVVLLGNVARDNFPRDMGNLVARNVPILHIYHPAYHLRRGLGLLYEKDVRTLTDFVRRVVNGKKTGEILPF